MSEEVVDSDTTIEEDTRPTGAGVGGVDRSMSIRYLNPDKTSWILVCPRFLPSTPGGWQAVSRDKPTVYHKIMMFGKEVAIPRLQQSYGRDYGYSGNVTQSIPFTPVIDEIRKRVIGALKEGQKHIPELRESNVDLNMCLVNWYENGGHYIGPHSDDTRQLVSNGVIASLSWGATRKFELIGKRGDAESTFLMLEDGDLIVMGGRCQDTHKHAVPKSSCQQERINFTFRVFR